MDGLMIGLFAAWGCLVASWIAYVYLTNKILKDQEKEIEELKHKNKKLRIYNNYLRKSRDQYKAYFDSVEELKKKTVLTANPIYNLKNFGDDFKKAISDMSKNLFGEW